jgi:hypothetical protein
MVSKGNRRGTGTFKNPAALQVFGLLVEEPGPQDMDMKKAEPI